MNIIDKIKQKILKISGSNKLSSNPNSQRYNFIGNADEIRMANIEAGKIWYIGDCEELDNYYLNMDISGFAKNPIYNENKKQYFHSLSREECNIKKIHTGIPRAAITTMVNIVGVPKITCDNQEAWNRIAEANDFASLLTQQIRPLTLAEGFGATKIIFNKNVSKCPLITYYEALDCDYVCESGIITGIIYKDYYKYQDKDYLLLETRSIENGNSKIEFELFRYSKNGDVTKVELGVIPSIAKSIPQEGYIIPGVGDILGQPIKYLFDPLNKNYGLSILSGRIDIADDMDMIASIESMTEKNSSPVTYYPVDLLTRTKNGAPQMPQLFNREFVKKPTLPNGQGVEDSKIDVDSPQLDFAKYSNALTEKVKLFLSGWLAPASFGIDVAKKDNAEAQREKEKTTIMTRNNMISSETIALKKLVNACLMMQEYMDTNQITITDYNVNVKYNEFANPSMETMLPILGQAWVNGEISTERYVKTMYPDETDEEIEKEIAWLDENKKQDDLGMGDLMNEDTGERANEETPNFEEQTPDSGLPIDNQEGNDY